MPTSNPFMAIVKANGNQPISNPPLMANPNKTPKMTWDRRSFANKPHRQRDRPEPAGLINSRNHQAGSQPGVPGGTRMPRNLARREAKNPQHQTESIDSDRKTAVTII